LLAVPSSPDMYSDVSLYGSDEAPRRPDTDIRKSVVQDRPTVSFKLDNDGQLLWLLAPPQNAAILSQ